MLKRGVSTVVAISIMAYMSSISFINADNIAKESDIGNEMVVQADLETSEEKNDTYNESMLYTDIEKNEDGENVDINLESDEDSKDTLVEEESEILNGWVSEEKAWGTVWKYYKEGHMLENEWLYEGGKWYYLGYNGHMVSDELYCTDYDEENNIGYSYYFYKDGSMRTEKGWYRQNEYGFWYYLNEGGLAKTNQWLLENGKWYYIQGYEGMIYGETEKIDDIYYNFDNSGVLTENEGWKKTAMYEDFYNWVYTNKDGTCKTGWFLDNGEWYYFDEYVNEGNWDIYMIEGTLKIDDKVYYFNEDGSLSYEKGWKKHIYNSEAYEWYYLNGDGTCKIGWFLDNGVWYYWDEEYGYAFNNGVHQINGTCYYFNNDGSMCVDKGWKKEESYDGYNWYYLNGDGTIKIGWLLDNGIWYYWTDYGRFLKDCTYRIDGVNYIFNENGACINP